jgi:hypothetical protein
MFQRLTHVQCEEFADHFVCRTNTGLTTHLPRKPITYIRLTPNMLENLDTKFDHVSQQNVQSVQENIMCYPYVSIDCSSDVCDVTALHHTGATLYLGMREKN